ncbi:MAG TPA: hypothetical protein VN517_00755 [Terriglobales bacterium]|jgi:hypothetical protein|nr:hypothetical protein [Terriglobales bacterium]
MSELPSYDLELKAAEERRRIHGTLAELRSRVHEELNVKKRVREHLAAACGVAAVLSLGVGYSIAGIFVHN